MSEFEIGGVSYRSSKINAFKQLHIARRIAPVLGGLSALAPQEGVPTENSISALMPIANALAAMSDDQLDYVLVECLRVVTRVSENAPPIPLIVPGTGKPFGDLELSAMLQIAVHVIRENLEGFFAALPPMSPDMAEKIKGLSS